MKETKEMKNLKKIAALLLAMALVLSLFAACEIGRAHV